MRSVQSTCDPVSLRSFAPVVASKAICRARNIRVGPCLTPTALAVTFGAVSYILDREKRNHYTPFVVCADISAPRIKGVFSVSLYTAPVQSRSQPVVPGKKPGRLLSTNQAAEYLGVSPNTIRKYSAAGKIKAFRVGVKLIKYDPADLDAFKQQVGGQ